MNQVYINIKLAALLLVVFSFSMLKGQEVRRMWDSGPLTWDDFQDNVSVASGSNYSYFLGYEWAKNKYNDTTVIRFQAYCYIDTMESWVHPFSKNDRMLQFNQVGFDIVELYRRKLQFELDRADNVYVARDVFERMHGKMIKRIKDFEEESENGNIPMVTNSWGRNIGQELRENKLPNAPMFTKRNFGYGLNIGLGTTTLSGTLQEYYRNPISLVFGFDLAYKRHILFLQATLGGSKVHKDFVKQKTWEEGDGLIYALADASYGFAVLDNHKWKLTPFAGFAYTEFSLPSKEEDVDPINNGAGGIIYGINADYKFRKRLSLLPSWGSNKEWMESNIRARLYLTHIRLNDFQEGTCVNFSIGWSGFGNCIRVRKYRK